MFAFYTNERDKIYWRYLAAPITTDVSTDNNSVVYEH